MAAYVLLAALGFVFGSFANVVIWRLPRGESLNHPGSHCPKCSSSIAWYDNVPVLSYIFLGGQCRVCGARISLRYPIVELLSALLWLAAGIRFGITPQAAFAMVFFFLLLILAFIDIDTMRLPNALTALLFVIGAIGVGVAQFAQMALVPLLPVAALPWGPGVSALIGASLSAGLALAIAAAYGSLRKTQGFGMGDVKLLGVIGVFLGLYGLMVFFLGSVMGAVYGVIVARRSGGSLQHKFAFGPFLALAAVLVTLFGPTLWYSYLGIFAG
ncbi:MAG: prepilin peptidase [Coriobacteriia bacterium]|nr:prepilin peptidase [Coriobacteriia bacterium]